ncbi:TRAP transporter large permease [Microvirga pudoricolor]|uniref:TRAP transporter large permease n=1 Tax=Microvirga pudoricolor TaxID=2778729 RepID=UPI0019516552|nr:TRAP transporter large permease [Microvirga pudoricolor]MBM6593627.1 TRAP transporter large permease [Microvirga pudoricolor]
MSALFVTLAALALMASGAAVAYTVGAATVLAFLATDNGRFLAILPQRLFSQVDVFDLMAMPLFILTGEIMNKAGITRAMIDLSMAILGRLKGGLGYVNIMTSLFLSGISGSAVADAAALSNTLVPAMRDRGYPVPYAGALTSAAAMIGPIIPPSIIMIFYAALMQTSVAALFIAGIVPGILMAATLFGANAYYARRDGHPGGRTDDVPAFWPALRHALPSLSLPVIIVGGIVVGVVTPTEAGALAVLASIAVGAYYGGLNGRTLRESLEHTVVLTGTIFMVLCSIAAFGWLVGHEGWLTGLAEAVTGLGLGQIEYLLLINVIFVVAGIMLDPPIALPLLVPLLAPLAVKLGTDPVHLGLVLCLNLTIGMITPPFGGVLLIVSSITKGDYWQLNKAVTPFAVILTVLLFVLVLVPELSLFLPRSMGFID